MRVQLPCRLRVTSSNQTGRGGVCPYHAPTRSGSFVPDAVPGVPTPASTQAPSATSGAHDHPGSRKRETHRRRNRPIVFGRLAHPVASRGPARRISGPQPGPRYVRNSSNASGSPRHRRPEADHLHRSKVELHGAFRCPGLTETGVALGVLLNGHVLGDDVDGNYGTELLLGSIRTPFVCGRSAGSAYFSGRQSASARTSTRGLLWRTAAGMCCGRSRRLGGHRTEITG